MTDSEQNSPMPDNEEYESDHAPVHAQVPIVKGRKADAEPKAKKSLKKPAQTEDLDDQPEEKPAVKLPSKLPGVKSNKKATAAVLDTDEEPEEKPKKPKAKKPADPAAPKVARGMSDDAKKYKAALKELEKSGLVIFDELTPRSLHVKLNTLLTKWILDELSNLKAAELSGENDPANPYPANRWATAETKVAGKEVVTKKTPKTRTHPGMMAIEDPIEVSNEESGGDEEPASGEVKKIKNIVMGNSGCRNYLAFIMIRFIHELNYTKSLEDVESAADFKKFVFEQVSDKVKSQMARVIICTVDRLKSSVKKMPGFEFSDISDIFAHQIFAEYEKPKKIARRPGIARYAAEYLMHYYQLIAKFLAAELWVKHKSINGVAIEQAMRCLNIGNDTQGRGLEVNHNVLKDMHAFDICVSPPAPAALRKPRTAKAKAAE
jgi:hypothetical protein